MTAGTDGKTIDAMSLERVDRLIAALKDESYQPKPSRRTYIPKKNGKLRPLGIPSIDDKLVQEVVRMLLESIYENSFEDTSHGFRPNKSCHTALRMIQNRFTRCKWFVEGDIKGFFDNIDHNVMIGILRKRIKDERFLRLIRKFLNAGYMEDNQVHQSYSGTPQGGIISPILANIYLDQFDKYMAEFKKRFDRGNKRAVNVEYRKLSDKRIRLKRKLAKAKTEEEKQALIEKYGNQALRPAVKMSKSLGNVVNPDDVVKAYGADTMRLYIMFIGDFEKVATWSDDAVKGSKRFLDRCWNLMDMATDSKELSEKNEAIIHKTIRKVTQDIDELKMNTAIAALMTMVNEFYANGLTKGDLEMLMLMLSPFAPHMVEEMWELTGYAAETGKMAMHESKTVASHVEMAVQVLGKLRGTINVPVDSEQDFIVSEALKQEKVAKFTEGKQIVKVILVKNKLVNLIVK